ncbi:uncharacterized protein LOC121768041 [Salvia splendens]|uniref:uncharacterized protein LOC121768041 n=1 Tax=Salvia splendens TaxID=180675 RepID=UPI001C25FC7D|nr:uncharacterized protein LOC121768041 [Salvia splendens]
MQIFDQIEHYPSPPISMDKKQVESLTEIVMYLQEFLEGYKSPFADVNEADPLEMRIADAVYAAEDVIESHLVEQLRPDVLVLYEALSDMIEDMNLMVEIKERVIKRVDLIFALKGRLRGQVSDSSTSRDLHKRVGDLIKDIQLLENRVMEHMDWILELECYLQRQVSDSSTCADLYKAVVEVIERMSFIKQEVMVIF